VDRLACVDLPELPLQLLLRRHPEWTGAPVAVVAEDRPQAFILWVNESARRSGVLPGQRFAQGLALETGLRCGTVSRAEVYRHGSATMSSVTLAERPGAEEPTGRCERLRIRFETPTLLRAEGSVATVPEFGVLVKRLRDRVSALHYFYCGAAWEADHRGLGRLAEEVRAAEVRTGWVSRVRRSSRTGQRHPLEGFVGEAVYEGRDLRPFLPLLRVGERVHVGKAATFGQGRFRVLDEDPS
jgi:hypothetical protein